MHRLLLALLVSLLALAAVPVRAANVALMGFVVGPDGQGRLRPVEGATVRIDGSSLSVVTDARGAFMFERVPAGDTTVVVTHPAYAEGRKALELRSPGPASVLVTLAPLHVERRQGGGDVYVALALPLHPSQSTGPLQTVLHYLGGLSAGWDPVKEGHRLQEEATPITAARNALMRMPDGDGASASYSETPTRFYWVAFSPDGQYLMATTDRSSVQVYSLGQELVLERTIRLPQPSLITSLHAAPGGVYATAFTPQNGMSSVLVLDPHQTRLRATYVLPATEPLIATDVVVSPDGGRLYVAAHGKGTLRAPGRSWVFVLDAATGAVVGRQQTAAEPLGLALTLDRRRLFVSNQKAAAVTVLDADTLQSVARIQVGIRPTRIAVSPDGHRVAVCCAESNKVYIIDPSRLRVLSAVKVDENPLGLAFMRDGRLVVGCTKSRTVCIIEGSTVRKTSPQARSVPYGIAVRP